MLLLRSSKIDRCPNSQILVSNRGKLRKLCRTDMVYYDLPKSDLLIKAFFKCLPKLKN